jgi:phosphate transport system protein
MRINIDLERIGDYARSIVKSMNVSDKPVDEGILNKSQVLDMLNIAVKMLTIAQESFESENHKNIHKIFKHDETLDKVNKNADELMAKLIRKNPSEIINCLNMYSNIRRLERVGDQTKNIAEEIVFYIDAKVLKHKKKKEKLDEIK